MVSRFVVVTPDKSVLQEMGFSCETRGNWSSREKESKVVHLDYKACTLVPSGKGQIYRFIHRRLKQERAVIDSWRIHIAGMS